MCVCECATVSGGRGERAHGRGGGQEALALELSDEGKALSYRSPAHKPHRRLPYVPQVDTGPRVTLHALLAAPLLYLFGNLGEKQKRKVLRFCDFRSERGWKACQKGMLAIIEQMQGSDSPCTYLDSPGPASTSPRRGFFSTRYKLLRGSDTSGPDIRSLGGVMGIGEAGGPLGKPPESLLPEKVV